MIESFSLLDPVRYCDRLHSSSPEPDSMIHDVCLLLSAPNGHLGTESRQERHSEAPLTLASPEFHETRLHFLETAHFAFVDCLIKASAMNDL